MTPAEQQLLHLMERAEETRKAAEDAVAGLQAERKALGQAVAGLQRAASSGAEAGASQALSGASQAVQAAAAPLLEAVQAERQAVAEATRWLGWRAAGLAGGLLVIVGAAAWGLTAWHRAEVAALRAEAAQLRAAVDDLTRRGGRAQLSECGPQRRLCVAVDTGAGQFGQAGAQYLVIRGY